LILGQPNKIKDMQLKV